MKKIELKLQIGAIAPYSDKYTKLHFVDPDIVTKPNAKSIAVIIVKKNDLSNTVKVGKKVTLTITVN